MRSNTVVGLVREGRAEEEGIVERENEEQRLETERTPLRSDSANKLALYNGQHLLTGRAATPALSGTGASRTSTPVASQEDIHGLELCRSFDFWIICGIIGCRTLFKLAFSWVVTNSILGRGSWVVMGSGWSWVDVYAASLTLVLS